MADDPPISTTVPETTTIDSGADKESIASLNEQFADFWQEADSKTELAKEPSDAPPAPGEGGPAQETREKTSAEPRVESEASPLESKPALKKEISDEEIDKIELPPHSKPELIEQVKTLKDHWKADRARARAEAERAKTLQSELEQARANAWTPEAKADYEHAVAIRRKFDFVSDPDFLQKFHEPVRNQFINVLNEAIAVLPNQAAAQAWANDIAQNYPPDQLDRNWWLNSVVAKVPNELDRATLLASVTELLKKQKERDTEVWRRTQDRSAFDNWIKEKSETTSKRVQEEIMAEIGVQEKRIAEVLPRDVAQAKTAEERRAIEDHNERFNRLNGYFQEQMKDLGANGPRAWVRVSVEATRARLLETECDAAQKELKSVKAERDQLKGELDRIAGARRRISHTTGTPPTPTGKKPSSGDGLSVKDLDIRKAFDRFDWGEST